MNSTIDASTNTQVFPVALKLRVLGYVNVILIVPVLFFLFRELIDQLYFWGWLNGLLQSWWIVMGIGVSFVGLVYSLAYVTTTKLHISSTGVTYISVFFAVQSSWDNIVSIGSVRRYQAAFLLREPAHIQGLPGLAVWWNDQNAIPLAPFGQWWGNSDLGQSIQLHAPNLYSR